MSALPIHERSQDWKNGFQRGVAHAKDTVWRSVVDYVRQHDQAKADALRADILKAITEKTEREREAEVNRESDVRLREALRRLLATIDPGNTDEHKSGCDCVIHEARSALSPSPFPSVSGLRR